MSSSPTSTSSTKNTKWVTHLALSADVILGKPKSENCVHEIDCTFDDSQGQIHKVALNCWARDVPEQGVYILVNVPFATHPLRLGLPDIACLRQIPDELDGSEVGGVTLPAAPVFLTGIGVIHSTSPDRKSVVIKGLTYLNKTHQWQSWTLNSAFPDTPKYSVWTAPGPRNLVSFDCTVISEAGHHTFDTALNRITLLGPAPAPLLQALGVVSPATDDRAERIRQARAARQARPTTPTNPAEVKDSNGLAAVAEGEADTPKSPAVVPRAVTPTPSQRKRGRHD
ncbi:hypothetical protein A4X13_0g4943 [Tilletia indica]|uniref:Uncharacterized protein n=1 Tax=Tilletia indica TaxID=43049 RepID=A0A177T1X4_9BASI|nr:hypothetical protein A4X13_0g4943 [Tilletia indica]